MNKRVNKAKSIGAISIAVLLALSCSKEIATVVPNAPSNLISTAVTGSQINLTWTDNSTNESGFKIERKLGTGNYSELASVNTDLTSYTDVGIPPSTIYSYRVYAYNSSGKSLGYSNESTIGIPTLTTAVINSFTESTAISGGTVINDGGSSVISRGVVWGTTSGASIPSTSKTVDGSGIGTYTSNLTGLSPSTTYFIRAYATNKLGTNYGNEVILITKNGSDAQIVKLSNTWKVITAMFNGTPQTGYGNFRLTMSGTSGQTIFGYSTSGRPALSPWPASGTFTFGTDIATSFVTMAWL